MRQCHCDALPQPVVSFASQRRTRQARQGTPKLLDRRLAMYVGFLCSESSERGKDTLLRYVGYVASISKVLLLAEELPADSASGLASRFFLLAGERSVGPAQKAPRRPPHRARLRRQRRHALSAFGVNANGRTEESRC